MFSKFYLLLLFVVLKDGSCLFWHNHHQNREDNSERKDVHTIPLSSDITFYWRYLFNMKYIIENT